MIFFFLDKPSQRNSSAGTGTRSTLVDTRQMIREKTIAESYWQRVFDEERQKKA